MEASGVTAESAGEGARHRQECRPRGVGCVRRHGVASMGSPLDLEATRKGPVTSVTTIGRSWDGKGPTPPKLLVVEGAAATSGEEAARHRPRKQRGCAAAGRGRGRDAPSA
jgi:hypothetical protein